MTTTTLTAPSRTQAAAQSSAPTLVSELPLSPAGQSPAQPSRGPVATWFAERRQLRQHLAFERALSSLDPATRADVLSTSRSAR